MGRTNRRDNSFTYTCKYGFFAGTTHQLFDIGSYRNASPTNQLNTIFRNSRNRWRIKYLWVNGHTNGLKNIASSKVDSGCHFESQRYICCLLYTSDAADEEDSVDLGGRRIIK